MTLQSTEIPQKSISSENLDEESRFASTTLSLWKEGKHNELRQEIQQKCRELIKNPRTVEALEQKTFRSPVKKAIFEMIQHTITTGADHATAITQVAQAIMPPFGYDQNAITNFDKKGNYSLESRLCYDELLCRHQSAITIAIIDDWIQITGKQGQLASGYIYLDYDQVNGVDSDENHAAAAIINPQAEDLAIIDIAKPHFSTISSTKRTIYTKTKEALSTYVNNILKKGITLNKVLLINTESRETVEFNPAQLAPATPHTTVS